MILLDGAKIAVRALLFVRRELLPDKWVFLQLDVIARFPPVSPISLKIGEVHRKANFSETQVDFLAGKIVFLVRASKIKIAPYS